MAILVRERNLFVSSSTEADTASTRPTRMPRYSTGAPGFRPRTEPPKKMRKTTCSPVTTSVSMTSSASSADENS